MHYLTADELVEMLDLFGEITILEEGPRDTVKPGATLLWPSFCADYVEGDRHVEAIVQLGDFNVILVSKRLYEVLK